MSELLNRARLCAGDDVWEIASLCVRPAELFVRPRFRFEIPGLQEGGCDDDPREEVPVVRCEVELWQRRRQIWRGFLLYYHAEFFEVWDIAENDDGKIALHARRWVANYLGGNGHRLDYSMADDVVRADIRF